MQSDCSGGPHFLFLILARFHWKGMVQGLPLFFLGFLIVFPSQAAADVLCQNPSGSVFVRPVCKKNETQLDPVALGLQGPPGPPANTLAVYDAHDNKIGDVLEVGAGVRIAFSVDAYTFILSVTKAGELSGTFSPPPRFESTDCSGTPLVPPPNVDSFFSSVLVGPPGNTVYLSDPTAIPQQFNYRSELTFTAGCQPINDILTGVPGIPLIDLDTLFTPPFSVQ